MQRRPTNLGTAHQRGIRRESSDYEPPPITRSRRGKVARITTPASSLRLLGGVALEREDGTAITGRAAQKRRLALLALLALAPGRCLSRDRLLAYLWPESDTEQARHLLAVAVYELRKALGDDIIVSRGDELELSAALLRTDVQAFEAALRAGEWEPAVALYDGPLLDGFFIGDASEFEHWLDAERERLARLFAGALESLARARAQAGDTTGSLAAWHRLAALDPYNSKVARELMGALEAAGDRARAIRHARAHATLLREEFGAEPDPEMEQFADRLRTAPAPAAAFEAPAGVSEAGVTSVAPGLAAPAESRPAPAAGAAPAAAARSGPEARAVFSRVRGRFAAAGLVATLVILASAAVAGFLWSGRGRAHAARCSDSPTIAVLPFRAIDSAEEHSAFGDGLAEDILNALSRINCLDVMPRSAVFEYRESAVGDAARGLQASHSLSGSWISDAEFLKVHAVLVDESGSRREVWRDMYERTGPWTTRDMADVQQEIATAVAAELITRLSGGSAPVVVPRTDSEQAWYALYQGRRSLERRTVPDMRNASRLFEEAVQLDPDYADAHAALAEVTALLGAYDYGLLPPREAYSDALRSANQALERDPLLAEAHATLGSVYFNHYYQWERAESAFRRAIEMKRGYSQSYHWYSLLLTALGRTSEAREQLERGLRYDRNSVILRTALSRLDYFTHDFAASIDGYLEVLERDSLFLTAQLGLGLAYAQIDRYDEAIAAFEHAEQIIGQPIPVLHGLLGYAHGRAGNTATARSYKAQLERAAAVMYVPAEYFALVHIGLGDLDAAVSALEQAYENGSGGIAYLAIEPVLDPLRSHPRFIALKRRVNLD